MGVGNRWNKMIYALWSPFYDLLVSVRPIVRARKTAHEILQLAPGETVCFVGVGTGADFEFLPDQSVAVGVDLSEAMLSRARQKLPLPGREIELRCADAQELPFEDHAFDAVVLSLILSVVPDGGRALAEAVRVTRPGGRLVVLDKFVPADQRISIRRRLLNFFIRPFGTDLTRAFEPMCEDLPLHVTIDRPPHEHSFYRVILLQKKSS